LEQVGGQSTPLVGAHERRPGIGREPDEQRRGASTQYSRFRTLALPVAPLANVIWLRIRHARRFRDQCQQPIDIVEGSTPQFLLVSAPSAPNA